MKKYIVILLLIAIAAGSYKYYRNIEDYKLIKMKLSFNEELSDKELSKIRKNEKIETSKELFNYIKKYENKKNYRVAVEVFKEEKDPKEREKLIQEITDDLEEVEDGFQALNVLEEIKEDAKDEKNIQIIDEKLIEYYQKADMFDKLEELRDNMKGGRK